MHDKIREISRKISLHQYLIVMMICIILLITGMLMTLSYLQAERITKNLDEYFQEYTELNIIERISLIDAGLKLYDNSLDIQMKEAFVPFLTAYNKSGNTLSHMNLSVIQHEVRNHVTGNPDLYIINKSGIIIDSTIPEVLYLNLSQNPDYGFRIPELIAGSSFKADRIVRSYSSSDSQNLTGIFRKFAFMPTPDHQYLLEIGISDPSFDIERKNLSYFLVSDEMSDINPYLQNIRIFDIHKNLFIKNGVIPPDKLDAITNNRLNEVIAARKEISYQDEEPNNRIQYLFIDLNDSESVSDVSVVVEILYSNNLFDEEQRRIFHFFAAIGTMAVLLGAILAFYTCRLVTRPISLIVEDVDMIAKGNLSHIIRGMEVREFSHLEQSINLMIHTIRTADIEIERRKTELTIASEIQRSFLPEILPKISGYDIAARSLPAKEVGGDFYDVIRFAQPENSPDTFGILIADVSGKGVPAALFMALSRTIIRVTAKDETIAGRIIENSNTIICEDARTGMFVSLFYAVISEDGNEMRYVNAGHNPPVIYHAADGKSNLLLEGGIVLGVDDSAIFTEEVFTLNEGDIVAFYTDGITEAINQENEMYGEERLCKIIRQNSDFSAVQLIDSIIKDLSAFVGQMDQFDDITLVILKKEQ